MINLTPQKLYKYQPYTVWSLDNLKNRQIRFSKPSEFNDPFDCNLTPSISEPTQVEWQHIFEEFRKSSKNKEAVNRDYFSNGYPNEAFKIVCRETIKEAFVSRKSITLNDRGIACFSETFDDLLMWSHYTNGHRGFCIEFNTKYDPFPNAFPVDYSDVIPAIDPVKILLERSNDVIIDLLRTKCPHWSYEKEWRICHIEGNKSYNINVSSLTAIYFGCSMLDVHKQIITALFSGTQTHFYEMDKVDYKFKLQPKAL